jgi:hypothetical protein
MPVPGVERIEGFTTTMYDIVKKVVMPAMASVRRLDLGSETVVIVGWLIAARSASFSRGFRGARRSEQGTAQEDGAAR